MVIVDHPHSHLRHPSTYEPATHTRRIQRSDRRCDPPPGDDTALRGHYEHLISQGRNHASTPTLDAYRATHRQAVDTLITALGLPLTADTVIACVEGAALRSLGNHDTPRETARHQLTLLLDAATPAHAIPA